MNALLNTLFEITFNATLKGHRWIISVRREWFKKWRQYWLGLDTNALFMLNCQKILLKYHFFLLKSQTWKNKSKRMMVAEGYLTPKQDMSKAKIEKNSPIWNLFNLKLQNDQHKEYYLSLYPKCLRWNQVPYGLNNLKSWRITLDATSYDKVVIWWPRNNRFITRKTAKSLIFPVTNTFFQISISDEIFFSISLSPRMFKLIIMKWKRLLEPLF